MIKRNINVQIGGRSYPLSVPSDEEETLRKVAKQIDEMIKNFEANFELKDKQDALAMCALRLGANAELTRKGGEENIKNICNQVTYLSQLLEE
ncbi:cell division protein ZapA [Riemerella columbipharyngis]|uniref:Cell division protein ZapA n=1 Tax=Riemerella columbipharyngis TaxID=1071918 RepID=A0A1G7DSM0_9FLAO|nr:cell division protein ZapA [Riemerella columbipharyngis]SDE54493.1 cell division protein ZapA [Riemerella columbipharyngis]